MTEPVHAATAPRSVWLVAGIVVALAGAGAVTYGVLDGEAPPRLDAEPEATVPPRADTHLGFLLGGLLATVLGLALVYRSTS